MKNMVHRRKKKSSHTVIGVRNDKSKDVPESLKAYINVSPEEVVENIAKFNELMLDNV